MGNSPTNNVKARDPVGSKNIHEYFFMMNAQGAVGGWGGEC